MLVVSDSDADGSGGGASASLRPGVTASGRQSRAKGATPREFADTLARLLGGASTLAAMWLDVEAVALEVDEADAIAEPAARILARASWGKRVGKYLVNGDDYVALIFAVTSYGLRVAPLVREKMGNYARPVTSPTPPPVRAASVGNAANTGHTGHNGHAADFDPAAGVRFSGVAGFGADA